VSVIRGCTSIYCVVVHSGDETRTQYTFVMLGALTGQLHIPGAVTSHLRNSLDRAHFTYVRVYPLEQSSKQSQNWKRMRRRTKCSRSVDWLGTWINFLYPSWLEKKTEHKCQPRLSPSSSVRKPASHFDVRPSASIFCSNHPRPWFVRNENRSIHERLSRNQSSLSADGTNGVFFFTDLCI
jgi:hypothetical protein